MSFVKSPAEIERIQEISRVGRFVSSQMLNVTYRTDAEAVARVLPPPLLPTGDPLVTGMVGRWQSNCVGDFDGGALYVHCRWGDVEGSYVLGMWMSSDAATIFGRDLYGEPKKISTNALFRSSTGFRGYVERNGIRILELAGDADLPLDTEPSKSIEFNFKARPAASGVGLEEDAILTQATYDVIPSTRLQGAGEIRLKGTVHDPVNELPVRGVTEAEYFEGDLIALCEPVASTPAETFLPYHYGRQDDWLALDTSGAQDALPSDSISRRGRPGTIRG